MYSVWHTIRWRERHAQCLGCPRICPCQVTYACCAAFGPRVISLEYAVVVVQYVTDDIFAGALCTRDNSVSGLNGLKLRLTGDPVVWCVACTTACVAITLSFSFSFCTARISRSSTLSFARIPKLFATLTYTFKFSLTRISFSLTKGCHITVSGNFKKFF